MNGNTVTHIYGQELVLDGADFKMKKIICEYCDTIDYRGSLLKLSKNIDGKNQYFEICIFDSPEDECHVLEIEGIHADLRIDIKYCPMCGKKL